MKARQHGGACVFILMALVIGLLFTFNGLRIVQAYIQNAAVESAFQAMVRAPELQHADDGEIRSAFSRRAGVDDIRVIQAEAIQISRTGGTLALSAEYDVTLPVVGNVSLLMKFTPHSGR
jgi:hypothetical protein